MNFTEAMEKLKSGKKVSRETWRSSIYFLMKEDEVKCFYPTLMNYVYDENIMISKDWMIAGDKEKYKFCDIILRLQQGAKARLAHWKDEHIYLDRDSKQLIVHTMEPRSFVPDFESFTAEDWVELK